MNGPTFSRADYDALKQAERILHDLMPQLDKAEACGIECSGFRGLAADLAGKLEAVERHFMTPPPTM